VPGHATQDEQVGQHVDDVRGLQLPVDPDAEALPSELVDHAGANAQAFVAEHAEPPTVVGASFHEVAGPDMVGTLGPKPDARAVVQPEPAALGLLGRYLQAFLPPKALDLATFASHPASRSRAAIRRPSAMACHRLSARGIAVSPVACRQLDDVGRQRRIAGSAPRHLALRRSVLPQDLSTPSAPSRHASS